MKKLIVIYTCITGEYDSLLQPVSICDTVDYICFVQKGEKERYDNAGVWQIREMDCLEENPVLASRYPKMMPHVFLSDYDYSVYVDANIEIQSADFYQLIESKISNGSVFSAPIHPLNDCIYDEAQLILKTGKDSLFHILRAVRFLKKNKFPHHWGLYENCLLFRKHLDPIVEKADTLWWNLYRQYPKRDQLLLTYCLKNSDIVLDYLLPDEMGIRQTPLLKLHQHNPISQSSKSNSSFLHRKIVTFPKLLLRFYCK